MKISSAIVTLFTVLLLFVVSARGSEVPPPYPGQPRINNALKHLNAAKATASTDANAALGSLEQASVALTHARKDKGTYQPIARQLVDEAKRHLEKGELDAALHKIDEAIANVNRAGETGER